MSEFMAIALEEAEMAKSRNEVPVGAVVVNDGNIISRAGNRTRELNDPTAHAEMLAIRDAAKSLGQERLVNCDLYVTLEPCPMCAAAISFARIRRLYFGAGDEKGGAVENGVRLYQAKTCHHAPEVYSGIIGNERCRIAENIFSGKAISLTNPQTRLSELGVLQIQLAFFLRLFDLFQFFLGISGIACNGCISRGAIFCSAARSGNGAEHRNCRQCALPCERRGPHR